MHPLGMRLGMVRGCWTPAAAKLGRKFMAAVRPGEAKGLLRAQGLPIGSGLLDAACKTLIAQRMKWTCYEKVDTSLK